MENVELNQMAFTHTHGDMIPKHLYYQRVFYPYKVFPK